MGPTLRERLINYLNNLLKVDHKMVYGLMILNQVLVNNESDKNNIVANINHNTKGKYYTTSSLGLINGFLKLEGYDPIIMEYDVHKGIIQKFY